MQSCDLIRGGMNNNGRIVRTEIMSESKPLDKILEQIEGFDVDNLSPEDKTSGNQRKAGQKKR